MLKNLFNIRFQIKSPRLTRHANMLFLYVEHYAVLSLEQGICQLN